VASVSKRATESRGDRYDVRYRGPDGRVRTKTFRTRRDADRFAVTIETDRLRGTWVDPHAGRITVEEYATAWLSSRPGLRIRTRETYESQLRRHVFPTLGPVYLNALTPRAIREWHSSLVNVGEVSANTAAKCYRVLRTILGTAVHDELIITNPCKLPGAGVERVAERPTATVAEVLHASDAMPEHLRLIVLLAGFCGLRVGELLGLERRHVNLLRGTLTVEQQEHQLKHGELIIGPPKSDAGRRTMALPPFLVAEIEEHLDRFSPRAPDGRVFRGEKGGPLRRHVLQTYWARARADAGLPEVFRFHDLRHTANTLAASSGASTRELMHRMGHASSQAAIRYQHATSDRDELIAGALHEMVQKSRGIPRDGRAMEPSEGADAGENCVTAGRLTSDVVGAGDENRTRVLSLGS
jgi:integrase